MLEFCFMEAPREHSHPSAYDREGRRKYLSQAEGKKFLEHVAHLPRGDALFCLILYYSGCRLSEALNLRQCDFDPEIKTIRIHSLKKREKKTVRRIPIPPFVANELIEVIDVTSDQRIWPFSRTTGWRLIKDVMKKAQISGIHATSKGLRHGFGVRGALNTIPISVIQRWMGHSDCSTTSIYVDVQDEEERELITRTW